MEVLSNNNLYCSAALAGLYDVFDPEIGLNVVDLGLIYRIDFNDEDKIIIITMTLTTQFCPMGESITADVQQSLSNAFKDYQISINLVFDPAWSPDRISPEGKEYLDR
ncbi:MAG: FeS assembly SUF system protein SufT [Sphingobacteriales bacterium 17-39-43]|uniref:metal-sulfur cluster assembly factor n=1 Tax=Daejeonella sp. TaxID=2805397 RepID=UPI000BC6EADA|nr:metal-sulfur cluster assembly factor [Daejeonella sp.]OYX95606.1 MAG: FeS assembly SUF system protein SufT [Sphingobacteriia bacterium 35-40-5]OYZ32833.1 MAG: FeS assembly SUF system protein SufT [Sphingobacteriales bacterium 16-39-50]OZA26243.1 MAG: FeS assembly SUF system protein SufT [Sphingobacteriales bacterium 17-39-43]HQT23187.1 metal-sulfur cluster assembly factor [Daejeonella sp.]HQT56098.1 metal-sulfur cluster assembly factor [Daejeonella sp.]